MKTLSVWWSLAAAALVIGASACASVDRGVPASGPDHFCGPGKPGFGLSVIEDHLGAATSEALAAATVAAYEQNCAPGAVVAVRALDGDWLATIGAGDRWGNPMEHQVYQRIGSITKTFAVTTLLTLVDDGLVSLDDPIGDYVADVPNPAATLYQLAAMRSGIPSYTLDTSWQKELFANPRRAWTPKELVDVVRDREPLFPPGTRMDYSNTNTVLLGMVIEQVTGEPVAHVMSERVLAPLGLKGTSFPTDASFPTPHARGYTLQGTDGPSPVEATDWNPSWGWTAGAMISTVADLLAYGRALVRGDLLSPGLQAERLDSFNFDVPPNSPRRAYGLGLGLANGWYGHSGELPGYNTVMQHHLDADLTVVVMVNSDIPAGACDPDDHVALPDGPEEGPCEDPAVHIANAVTAALGHPLAGAG